MFGIRTRTNGKKIISPICRKPNTKDVTYISKYLTMTKNRWFMPLKNKGRTAVTTQQKH